MPPKPVGAAGEDFVTGQETSTAAFADQLKRIANDDRYHALVARRTRFGWALTGLMLIAYFGYVLLIAFDKEFMGRPIGEGVTSIGIPLGFGIILLGILLTGIYVWRANTEFDRLLAAILSEGGS